MSRVPLVLLALLTPACAPSLEPSPLGDLSRELFRDYNTDPAAVVDLLVAVDTELAAIDLEAADRKRTFDVPDLTPEFRADLKVDPATEGAGQLGVGMAARSTHGIDDNVEAIVQGDQVCINADTVKCHQRDFLTDTDCFATGLCDDLATRNVIRVETFWVDFWIEAFLDFQRVELPDGRAAIVGRSWIEQPFDSDNGKSTWTQRYGLDVYVQEPGSLGGTRRWYATWLAGDVSGSSDGGTAQIVVGGIDEGFENPDRWLDGETCSIDSSQCEFPVL